MKLRIKSVILSFLLTPLLAIAQTATSASSPQGFPEASDTPPVGFPVVVKGFSVPDSISHPQILIPDNLDPGFMVTPSDSVLNLAIVLSDIYGKKEMEFTRGFLLGMKQANLPAKSVSLKIVNGEIPEDSLTYELQNFQPHVIFTTHDKDVPRSIIQVSKENGARVYNAFDVKGEDYLYNANIYQLLAPSAYFNGKAASYFSENFPDNVLLIVGEPDPSDIILRDMIVAWPDDYLLMISKEDLSRFSLEEGLNYLIYPASGNSSEIKEILEEVVRLMVETPQTGVRIIGRPNWVAFNDLNSLIANQEIFIPEKCYFDPTSSQAKKFISDYHKDYGHAPIRSYPVYAAMGYDASKYLLPNLIDELRGLPVEWNPSNMTQSYFDIAGSGWSGGFYNKGAFILHFEPWGTLRKEILK